MYCCCCCCLATTILIIMSKVVHDEDHVEQQKEVLADYYVSTEILHRYVRWRYRYHHLLRRLFSHMVFMAAFFYYVKMGIDIPEVFQAEKGVRDMILNLEAPMPLGTPLAVPGKCNKTGAVPLMMKFNEITTVEEGWSWIRLALHKRLYVDSEGAAYGEDKQPKARRGGGGNQTAAGKANLDYIRLNSDYTLIWGVRFRQHRVDPPKNMDDCRFVRQPADKLYHSEGGWMNEDCAGKWKGVHGTTPPPGSSSVGGTFYVAPEDERHDPTVGVFSQGYDSDGWVVDLPLGASAANATLAEMERAEWIDTRTRAVHITFHVIQPHKAKLLYVRLFFEKTAGGSFLPSAIFRASNFFRTIDPAVFAAGLLSQILLVDQFVHLMQELRRPEVSNRWFQVLDILTFGTSFHLFYDFWIVLVSGYFDRLVIPRIQDRNAYTDLFFLVQTTRATQEWFMALNFMGFLRAARFLKLSDETHLVWFSLKQSCQQFTKVMLIAVPIMIAFGCSAYLSFGAYASEFNTFPRSMMSLLRLLVRDEKIGNMYYDLLAVAPQLTPMFFMSVLFMYYFLLLSLIQGLIFSSWLLTRRFLQHRKRDRFVTILSTRKGWKRLCLWPCRESLYFFTRNAPELDDYGQLLDGMNTLLEKQKRDKQEFCALKDILGSMSEQWEEKQGDKKKSGEGSGGKVAKKRAEALAVYMFGEAKKANITLTGAHKDTVLAMDEAAQKQEKVYWTISASKHWGINFGYRFNSEEDAKDDTKGDDRKYIMLEKLNDQIRQLFYYQMASAQDLKRKILKTIELQSECASSVDTMEVLMEQIDQKNEMSTAFGEGMEEKHNKEDKKKNRKKLVSL